jgi:hypothetical protein
MYKIKEVFPDTCFRVLRWIVLHSVKLTGNTILSIDILYCHYGVHAIAPGSSNAMMPVLLSKLNDRAPP